MESSEFWAVPALVTFLGAPYREADVGSLREAGVKAAFFGAPTDTQGSPSRPGVTLGPAALREASLQYIGATTYEFRVNLHEYWRLADCGDVSIPGAPVSERHRAVRRRAETLLRAGALPIMCGGDHSIPIPGVAALCSVVDGPVGHLHIDSHLDNLESVGGERESMASPVLRLLENPQVDPRNVVIIGVRGASNPPEALERAETMGIHVISMFDVLERGVGPAIREALDRVWDGTRAVYVSFDNDSVDAAYAPGTTAPEPFGFTSREVITMAVEIGRRGASMIDIAELSPPYDPSGVTARLDLAFVIYLLSAYAQAIEAGDAEPPVQAASPS